MSNRESQWDSEFETESYQVFGEDLSTDKISRDLVAPREESFQQTPSLEKSELTRRFEREAEQ